MWLLTNWGSYLFVKTGNPILTKILEKSQGGFLLPFYLLSSSWKVKKEKEG